MLKHVCTVYNIRNVIFLLFGRPYRYLSVVPDTNIVIITTQLAVYCIMSRDNSTVRTRFLPDSRFTLTNYRFRGGTITHTHTPSAAAAEEAKKNFNTCNNNIDGIRNENDL